MTMRRLCLAALAVALLGALPARASGESYRGGCRAHSSVYPAIGYIGNDVYYFDGYLAVAPADDGYPAVATAWCSLRVYGVEARTVVGPVTGYGAVAAARTFTIGSGEMDGAELCEHVLIDDAELVRCGGFETYTVDLSWLGPVLETPDPLVCPVLAATVPEVPGLVDVDRATGDVYVADSMVWDCPPYEP